MALRSGRRLGVVSAALLLVALLLDRPAPRAQAPAVAQPNILVIVTDDQRADGLEVMPKTRAIFQQGGVTFTEAYAATPLCCPSRASIMSGRYGHNSGIRTNRDTGVLDHATTVQAHLHANGYQTAISGKFLLYWDLSQPPPNFDHWAVVNETDYYGDVYSVDGERRRIDQYSTDFIAERALEYLDRFESDDPRPWFLYVATQAPHAPFVAEPDYRDAPVPPWQPGPAVSEDDRSDKPDFVQVHHVGAEQAAREREAQLRTLYSVDDLVEAIFRRMAELGEEAGTLAVYTSDNGYFWGEHRLHSKSLPYTEGIRVPLMLRWPGRVLPGAADPRLATLVDIAPTLLGAAGIPLPADPPLDGTSLLGPDVRTEVLVEYARDPGFRYPTWASVRDRSTQYVEYYGDDGSLTFREYYDLVTDPSQLENLLADADPANDPDVTVRSGRMAQLRSCSGRSGPNPCP
jgi:arylsulfatase A-like enzyme